MDQRLKDIAISGSLCLAISFGHELGLFNALAAIANADKPATVEDLFEKTKVSKSYLQIWLNGMVSGDIIEATKDGKGFYIAEENLSALTGEDATPGMMLSRLVQVYSTNYNKALEQAKSGEEPKKHEHHHGHESSHGHAHGHGHGDNHSEAFPLMDKLTQSMHKKHLMAELLPLTGMKEKMEKGIKVLDVGCGHGYHACEFAKHFPNSQFIGIDISESAINNAKAKAAEYKIPNAEFRVINGEEMPADWTESFDFVYSIVSIHDHQNPDKAIKEINRVLKPEGRYSMLELNKNGNINEDKKLAIAPFWHNGGLFILLPIRGQTFVPKWTNALAVQMLSDAGFTSITPLDTPSYDFNLLFNCEK